MRLITANGEDGAVGGARSELLSARDAEQRWREYLQRLVCCQDGNRQGGWPVSHSPARITSCEGALFEHILPIALHIRLNLKKFTHEREPVSKSPISMWMKRMN